MLLEKPSNVFISILVTTFLMFLEEDSQLLIRPDLFSSRNYLLYYYYQSFLFKYFRTSLFHLTLLKLSNLSVIEAKSEI